MFTDFIFYCDWKWSRTFTISNSRSSRKTKQ